MLEYTNAQNHRQDVEIYRGREPPLHAYHDIPVVISNGACPGQRSSEVESHHVSLERTAQNMMMMMMVVVVMLRMIVAWVHLPRSCPVLRYEVYDGRQRRQYDI
jgi:hypothetical protein